MPSENTARVPRRSTATRAARSPSSSTSTEMSKKRRAWFSSSTSGKRGPVDCENTTYGTELI
jgi:hypothetical protein